MEGGEHRGGWAGVKGREAVRAIGGLGPLGG